MLIQYSIAYIFGHPDFMLLYIIEGRDSVADQCYIGGAGYGWIVVIIIPAKLCNQRKNFSHDVELNNKGILHLHFTFTSMVHPQTRSYY